MGSSADRRNGAQAHQRSRARRDAALFPGWKRIAFTASYQSNVDVYVIPAAGGAARRLTFQSDIEGIDPGNGGRMGRNNMVVTWTPDSKSIVFLSRREALNNWMAKLFTVPVEGGLPVALPLDREGY